MRPRGWAVALLTLAAPHLAAGQVADRVATVDEGTVRFSYDAHDDVEICDQGIRIGERHMFWRSRGRDNEETNCRFGFVEVELEIRNGTVRDVEIVRSPRDRTGGADDIGRISAEEASSYLLTLAREGATERAARDAILPALLVDVEEIWRDLVDLGSDRSLPASVRKNALFWLGQEAAEAATAGLADVALDEDENQEIRDAAIFALSQRPADQGLSVLMDLARSGGEAATRRTAIFWLGQSDDERVVPFFEEILLGPGR